MKPISRMVLVGSLAYLGAGLATLGYAVWKGSETGFSFQGVTGTESAPIKALECVVLWPYALLKTLSA